MGVGAGLYMCDLVKKFTFAISSPDEFLYITNGRQKVDTPERPSYKYLLICLVYARRCVGVADDSRVFFAILESIFVFVCMFSCRYIAQNYDSI